MAKQFVLDLNFSDWQALLKKSQSEGFDTPREFIAHKMEALASKLDAVQECKLNNIEKRRNIYAIPEEFEEAFSKLACTHSTSVSTVLFRYIVLDSIKRV